MKPILLAVLVATTACATENGGEVGYGEGLGTPENPVPREDSYAVASRINFAAELPQFQAALADLQAFSVNPARVLLATEVPALADLRAALSTTLEDRLEGWINTELDKSRIAGKTLREYAANMVTVSEAALTQFTLESSMTITPAGVTHSLTNLNFRPVNLDILVPIGGLKADTLMQRTTATVSAGGVLDLGEQSFGLAFGNHAWQAINLASTTLYAGDVRTSLVNAMNCPALAQTIATKCVSTACVGHVAQVQAVCEASIDVIVDNLTARIPAFKLDTFKFVTGNAQLVDANQDGIAEKFIDGTWDVQTDLGTGLRNAPAMFATTR